MLGLDINLIERGRNYGWPYVEGYCDLASEKAKCSELNVMEPIYAWTPTIAPAGISYYNFDLIQEWKNCILLCTLAGKKFVSLKLGSDGISIAQVNYWFENIFGRLRDECISPDGVVYIATSNKDGRGNPKPGDDRIIMVHPKNAVAVNNLNNNGKLRISYSDKGLNIESLNIEKGKYLISNSLGQIINTGTFTNKRIVIKEIKLNAGFYIISIENSHSFAAAKFLIN